MTHDSTWNKIIFELNDNSMEIATVPSNNKKPIWLIAYVEKGELYVHNAIVHTPTTNMSKKRKISKKDFDVVYSYYHRWANGERNLRQEVRLLSRNTAYIFALIAHFE